MRANGVMGTMKGGNGGGGGEIVQVQGGHIVRATGRKDRHSKVYTSKGPRDRRVRLSAHTAIQFYDVQDRLGFDRPSKAVDWLITKAKTSIDSLAHLPPFHPTTTPNHGVAEINHPEPPDCDGGGYESSGAGGGGGSSFLPPPELDSDSMKLFFPAEQNQDLGLSLHSSFHGGGQAAAMFAAPEPDGFGSGGAYQRLMGWGGSTGLGLTENPRGSSLPFQSPPPPSSSGGFFLINQNMPQPLMMVPQRVPLQSSNQLSPPSLGGFDEFRRGRFISDGFVGFGFQGRGEEHNGGPTQTTSPNSGHHR